MKKLIFILFMASPFLAVGQMLSPTVISNGGQQFSAGGFMLEFTLGELAVKELNQGGFILTAGFHQGLDMITSSEEPEAGREVTVFPNPARGYLTISAPESALRSWSIFGISGKALLIGEKSRIDLRTLRPGLYFLEVILADNGIYRTAVIVQ